jgi:hypothetical protein
MSLGCLVYSSTLKMEATCSSETSVYVKNVWSFTPLPSTIAQCGAEAHERKSALTFFPVTSLAFGPDIFLSTLISNTAKLYINK